MADYRVTIDSNKLKQRYDKISQIIDDLESLQITLIAKGGTVSYSLDDGQTRISTQYRNPEDIAKAIAAYEKILERISAKITGTRIVRLADAQAIQSNGISRRF